jgi:hypothetical protein
MAVRTVLALRDVRAAHVARCTSRRIMLGCRTATRWARRPGRPTTAAARSPRWPARASNAARRAGLFGPAAGAEGSISRRIRRNSSRAVPIVTPWLKRSGGNFIPGGNRHDQRPPAAREFQGKARAKAVGAHQPAPLPARRTRSRAEDAAQRRRREWCRCRAAATADRRCLRSPRTVEGPQFRGIPATTAEYRHRSDGHITVTTTCGAGVLAHLHGHRVPRAHQSLHQTESGSVVVVAGVGGR